MVLEAGNFLNGLRQTSNGSNFIIYQYIHIFTTPLVKYFHLYNFQVKYNTILKTGDKLSNSGYRH